jgi:hypothetical protein
VTAVRKLLLSAAILAAGYGVAALLGEPNRFSAPQLVPLATANRPAPLLTAPPLPADSPRLVPDPQGEAASHFRIRKTDPAASSLPVNSDPLPDTGAANAQLTDAAYAPELLSSANVARSIPQARLLNEAPRPIPIGPYTSSAAQQSRPAIRRDAPHELVTAQFSTTTPYPVQVRGRERDSELSLNAAQFGDISTPQAATSAPMISPNASVPRAFNFVSIPETYEPRSHIVVDGDSLAKLAGRYLDDPHRASEIYELNRDRLNDPELLPIGVELAIPPRSAIAHSMTTAPQSSMPRTVAIHAPTASGLVQIKPVQRSISTPPRAYLAPPRPAE